MDNDAEGGRVRRPPRYEGEDLTLTTDRELRGWYTYAFAAEVFAVCGVGSFLPITLEQLARENGVLLSDPSKPCVARATDEPNDGAAAALMRLMVRADVPADNGQCVIHFMGAQINSASFAMYTFSVAVFVQALVLVSLSAMADYGNNRKGLLLGFGLLGGTATMLFLLVFPPIYPLGSLLVIIAVACLGASWVMLNSFLPLLVSAHPSLQGHGSDFDRTASIPLNTFGAGETEPNRTARDDAFQKVTSIDATTPELQLSAKISSKGVGIGYGAAVMVQVLCILLIFIMSKTSIGKSSASLPLRIIMFFVGLWWFVFTLVSRLWLRRRPGPPLNSHRERRGRSVMALLAYMTFGWTSLWKTIKIAVKLRQVVTFLIAWFLLSDAIATISGTAILFAKTELHMTTVSVALLSILSTTSGLAGAFAWPIISQRLKLRANQTIIVCICMFEIIPIYGLMGYLPFFKAWGWGGLQQPWEIYPLGFVHGFVMGGLSSYCRSFYGLLIPPGSEAAFYALFAITDKGSSVIGPAAVGAIVDATGNIRPAFWFLAVLVVSPAPLLYIVNAEKGRADGVAMAEKMKGFKISDEDGAIGGHDREEEIDEVEGLLAEGEE